tara:strand:+ start:910 stop:2130 length:1221 start_codon:yes stop_codon:yes gene_type:complete
MSKFKYVYRDPTISENACLNDSTPYGIYDTDTTFCSESVGICKFVARRLGFPTMQLEYGSGSIYAMFEEAVSEYSQQINHYNMKNWLWEQYGADKLSATGSMSSGSGTSTQTNNPVTPSLGLSVHLSQQYGQEVGLGGDVTMYTGSIILTSSQQVYDFNTQADIPAAHSESRLEIMRVFNEGPSAITRFYDPYAGSYDQRSMLDGFGFGNASPAVEFILRPVSYDIARAQAIETSDKVRKSNYSFELINNQIRLFPKPDAADAGDRIWFQYQLREDKRGSSTADNPTDYLSGTVSDPSNAPYKFLTYSEINAPGRQWIRKYTLALSKELLGIIRSKYQTMPIPNGEVTMDGEGLKAEGREEKQLLLDELKEFLESVTLTERSRAEQEQAEAQQQVLNKSPLKIYLG